VVGSIVMNPVVPSSFFRDATPHGKLTGFLAGVPLCQGIHQRRCGRHDEPFAVFGKACLVVRCLGRNVAGRLDLAVEDGLQQATPERTQKPAPIVRIGKQHCADAGVRQKVKVAFKARQAAAVTDNPNKNLSRFGWRASRRFLAIRGARIDIPLEDQGRSDDFQRWPLGIDYVSR